jgi:type IV pilus assembly protein PilV
MIDSNKPLLNQTGKPHRQAGATLVEVMVAFLVLSIGLLGLAMLQAKSLRMNTDAYLRSQATLITNELIESMRSNPTGNYTAASKPAPCGGCTGATKMANEDLIRWYQAQADLLPPPATPSSITPSGTEFIITINWRERDRDVKQEWHVNL